GGGGGEFAGTPPAPLPGGGGPTLPTLLLVQEALSKFDVGVSRDDAIATFGLPFRDGDVPEVAGRPALGVTGTSAWQARTLAKWPDGTVAWALLDVAADITAGQVNSGLAVTAGTGKSAQANLASETASLITVDTGPLQVQVRKSGFNLLDRVVVDGVQIVAPGTSLGITGQSLALQTLAPDAGTLVALEENGPARAVVRADGTLAAGGTGVIDFTCRITARRGSRDVEVTLTLRNATILRPQHTQLEGVELSIQTAVGSFPYARLARHDGVEGGTLFPGDVCWLRQAYSAAPTQTVLGTTPNYLPHIPKLSDYVLAEEGYELVFAGNTVHALGDKTQFPLHGWVDLSGATAGVTVAARQMPYEWPGALEVAENGEVRAGVFTTRNVAPYTFIWRQHESRTVLFDFHTGISDPELTARMLDCPVTGRAADYKHYDRAGVFPYRLVTLAEQNQVYAALGLTHTVNIHNDGLLVTRFLYKGTPGASNNHDIIEKQLGGEWLRHGNGGQWLSGMDLALWKSEWQIPRSDDFDTTQDPGPSNDSLPHTTSVVADNEHRYRDGQILAYYLSGDERFRDGLLDEAELLRVLPALPHERSAYMAMRATAHLALFTGDPGGALLNKLRAQVELIGSPLLDMATQTSGYGWQSAPGTGSRRWYVNSSQFDSEKPPGENFQSRGFISGSLGPQSYYCAWRALLTANPNDASGLKARARMRDLCFYTRNELYPYNPVPANRHWVYSYAASFMQVTEWSTSDFHPLLLGMGQSWLDTGDPGYLQRGVEQIQAFAAHDQSGSYPDNLYEMESRLDVQDFFAVYRYYLGL
ncbi:MAG TPA: hypothetical protein VFF36_11750, partial [Planctomycetota bacterium]|nr:hypothetical protein [Planctomycetota bacterium]